MGSTFKLINFNNRDCLKAYTFGLNKKLDLKYYVTYRVCLFVTHFITGKHWVFGKKEKKHNLCRWKIGRDENTLDHN